MIRKLNDLKKIFAGAIIQGRENFIADFELRISKWHYKKTEYEIYIKSGQWRFKFKGTNLNKIVEDAYKKFVTKGLKYNDTFIDKVMTEHEKDNEGIYDCMPVRLAAA